MPDGNKFPELCCKHTSLERPRIFPGFFPLTSPDSFPPTLLSSVFRAETGIRAQMAPVSTLDRPLLALDCGVFVIISGDGTIKASAGQTIAWWQSFARHHQIRFDQIRTLTISTIFLGVADRLPDGALVGAFETSIFGPDGLSQESWRWSTLKEARAGHAWALVGVI